MSKTFLIAGGASVVSLAVGAVVGAIVTKKHLDAEYNEAMEHEIARTKEYYEKKYKQGKFATPAQAAEALKVDNKQNEKLGGLIRQAKGGYEEEKAAEYEKLVQEYNNAMEPEIIEINGKEVVVEQNIFRSPNSTPEDPPEILSDEILNERSPDRPYIITVDEHTEGEVGYDQVTVTYYEGDDTLADEQDKVIPTVDETVGKENLAHFGKWSRDRNTVYVRNDRIQIDFEIARTAMSYTEVVLGYVDARPHALEVKRRSADV